MGEPRDRSDEDTDEHPVVGFGQPAPADRPDSDPSLPPEGAAGEVGPLPPPGSWHAPQPPAYGAPPGPPPQHGAWQAPQAPQQQWPQQQWQQPQQPGPWQAPQQSWQQQRPSGPPGQWPQQGYWPGPRYGSSGLAIAGAVSLIVLGVLFTFVFGLMLLLFDAVAEFDGELSLTRAEAQAVKIIVGGIVVVAILQVIAGIGALAHREWARIIGIVIAVLGTLLGALAVIGVLVDPDPFGLVIALFFVGGYALALFGLIAGSVHFRRHY